MREAGARSHRARRIHQESPDIWRYFVAPHTMRLNLSGIDEAEYVMRHVFRINKNIDGAFVASSGKDMGAFKGGRLPPRISALSTDSTSIAPGRGRRTGVFPPTRPAGGEVRTPFTL